MRRRQNELPTFDDLFVPSIEALRALGGSGTTDEIFQKVVDLIGMPNRILEVQHGGSSQSEVEYRLAWSRTYLRKFGLIDNSSRGVWALTPKGREAKSIDPKEIVRTVRNLSRNSGDIEAQLGLDPGAGVEIAVPDNSRTIWRDEMRNVLLALEPAAFERLVQRLLRESGFIQVEVTGKSGDGGIDGIGIARINGFLSFHVLFQAKRYQGVISPSQIRDFRGAMQGRTDKGLFITTGTFSREAMKEATRDGAPPIDLIDGEQLSERLKELGLGVNIKMVEAVEIDAGWFAQI